MNVSRILRWAAVLVASAALMAGCQSGGGGHGKQGKDGSSSSGGKTVGFNYDMPYQLDQVGSGEGALTKAFSASDIFTGTLTATNTDTSEVQTFDWSVYLDESTLAVQSNKTIVLDPGTYDFTLLLQKGDHTYAGEALGVSIADGTDNVALTIRPVIGDVTTNVSVVARLIDLRFSYDPAEFSGAGIADPRIGITVDGGAEQLFVVNPASGLSEYMYLNLSPGAHDFVLRLFDGAVQRGKSLTAQTHQTLSPGVGVTMDLVALHGETTFSLAEAGGDATFHFVIPAEVVNEAGGTGDLQAVLHVARTESAANPADEQALSLTPSGGDYVADVTLPGFEFESVTVSLSFTDITDDYPLGACLRVVVLTDAAQSVPCDMTLVRRAVVSGNLLATLGVNVFSTGMEPLAGLIVRANGIPVGITGSGFGTPGYVKVHLLAGHYTISSDDGTMQGESDVDLDPLDVDNVDVILDDVMAPSVAEFNYSGLIETWTVPGGVTTVNIEAWGAEGGFSTGSPGHVGGRGARMKGDVTVSPGSMVLILAGQRGTDVAVHGSGGGGAFAVVVDPAAPDVMTAPGFAGLHVRPLVIAGGGGGIRTGAIIDGWGGITSQFGVTGSRNSPSGGGAVKAAELALGGENGTTSWGSGGGGWRGAGVADPGFSTGGQSFLAGGAGGVDIVHCGSQIANGGFGGGGSVGCGGGGGGGGYSGGDGGWVAGGAGSFNTGANQDNSSAVNLGNGRVVLTW